jgi:hypothetical protein
MAPMTTHNKALTTTSYAQPQADGSWVAKIDVAWRDGAGLTHHHCLTLDERFAARDAAEAHAFEHAQGLCHSPQKVAGLLADGCCCGRNDQLPLHSGA